MRHVRKQQKSLMPKILLIVVLVAALSISSVIYGYGKYRRYHRI